MSCCFPAHHHPFPIDDAAAPPSRCSRFCTVIQMLPVLLSIAVQVTAVVFALIYNIYFLIPAGVGMLFAFYTAFLTCRMQRLTNSIAIHNRFHRELQELSAQNTALKETEQNLREEVTQLQGVTRTQTQHLVEIQGHANVLEGLKEEHKRNLAEQREQIAVLENATALAQVENQRQAEQIEQLLATNLTQVERIETIASSLTKRGEQVIEKMTENVGLLSKEVKHLQALPGSIEERVTQAFGKIMERLPGQDFLEERERNIIKLQAKERALQTTLIQNQAIAERTNIEIAQLEKTREGIEQEITRLKGEVDRLTHVP